MQPTEHPRPSESEPLLLKWVGDLCQDAKTGRVCGLLSRDTDNPNLSMGFRIHPTHGWVVHLFTKRVYLDAAKAEVEAAIRAYIPYQYGG